MSKTADKKLQLSKFLEGENILKLNESLGRFIPYEEYDDKILNKRDYYNHKRNPNHISIILTDKLCKIPADYRLSNLPVLSEKRSMQDYHFEYTNEQLRGMCKTPKVIIDKFCNSFTSSQGIIERTSFYMIAPSSPSNIPSLYRLSITTSPSEPEHYSISLHAIVGGKEDGWLFLGRFDNDTVEPHKIAASEYSPKELKKHNAAKINCFTAIDMRIRAKAKVERDEELPDVFCIPFPHMHKPDPKYEVGEDIERNLPKFMKNCAYNSFEENIGYFLKIFNINSNPHFRRKDETICDIRREERRRLAGSFECDSNQIVSELFKRKQSQEIMAKLQTETQDQKKERRRQRTRVGKKEVYIQNKERIYN